jgi:hypothetical protein
MESIKDKISEIVKHYQEKLKPEKPTNYRLVERQKKLFYFTKFSFDVNEFLTIYSFVRKMKEDVFQSLFTQFQQIIETSITFQNPNLPEKEKIMALYSVCYLQYYLNFSYDTNNNFNDYFNINFIKLCEKFKFSINKVSKFQSLAYIFYSKMQNGSKNLRYDVIKRLYKYYNPSLVHDDEMISSDKIKKTNNYEEDNGINNFKKKIFTPLISAKQRIVDLVFEFTSVASLAKYPKEKVFIKSSLQKMNEMSKEYQYNRQIQETQSNSQDNNDQMEIDNDIDIENDNDNNEFLLCEKRVFSELAKCDYGPEVTNFVKEISEKIYECYLDKVLNMNTPSKHMKVVGPFVCYFLEFCPELIKDLLGTSKIVTIPQVQVNEQNSMMEFTPEGQEEKDEIDFYISFVVPAKQLYNLVLEIYFSISDLSYTTVNTFVEVAAKKGVQIKCATTLYLFIKALMKLMLEVPNDTQPKMSEIFQRFYERELHYWNREVIEKGKELTSFSMVRMD